MKRTLKFLGFSFFILPVLLTNQACSPYRVLQGLVSAQQTDSSSNLSAQGPGDISSTLFPYLQDDVQTFEAKYTLYFRPSMTLAAQITPGYSAPQGCTVVFTPATVPASGGPTSAAVTCDGTSQVGPGKIAFTGTSGSHGANLEATINVVACCRSPVAGTTTTLALGADLQAAVNAARGGRHGYST
jgi:hypothetical protein